MKGSMAGVVTDLIVTLLSLLALTHGCQPPFTLCDYNRGLYDPNDPLRILDIYGSNCVCENEHYDVCFDQGVSFSEFARARRSTDDQDCIHYCAFSLGGQKVCETQCSISDYDLGFLIPESSSIFNEDQNRKCGDAVIDRCCPERGRLCQSATKCREPRCQELDIEGCLQCSCLPLPPSDYTFIYCNLDVGDCSISNLYECSIGEVSGLVGEPPQLPPGGGPLPPLPTENGLEDFCGGWRLDFWNCKGTITTDENCCPVACIEKDTLGLDQPLVCADCPEDVVVDPFYNEDISPPTLEPVNVRLPTAPA